MAGNGDDRLKPMMSNEHGMPERATGAQGAGEPADGGTPNGSRGYSALAGGAEDDAVTAAGSGFSGSGFSASADGYSAGQRTREYDTWPNQAQAGPGEPGPGAHGGPLPGEPGQPGDSSPADPDRPEETGGKKRRLSGWRELPILIIVALTIALVIKSFVVQPFYIPSSSMEDTLMIGDKVLVNKLVYHFRSIQPGDIIVFNGNGSWNPNPPAAKPPSNIFAHAYDDTLGWLFHQIGGLFGTPADQVDFIKRVIGTPGDRVACCNAQGLVTVNGVALHESSYIYPGAAPSNIRFNIVVPPGRLWVMGDNRAVSDDSRLRMSDPGGGTIPENMVIGRAFVIIWPPSHWKFLSIPSTFSQPGISKSSSAAAGSQARADAAASAALNRVLGSRVAPEPPYVPLAAGVVGALPLTWLQMRIRRRWRGRRRDRVRFDRLRRHRLDRHS
jgi:signal peptidase I